MRMKTSPYNIANLCYMTLDTLKAIRDWPRNLNDSRAYDYAAQMLSSALNNEYPVEDKLQLCHNVLRLLKERRDTEQRRDAVSYDNEAGLLAVRYNHAATLLSNALSNNYRQVRDEYKYWCR